jgi:hypothetical protein
MSKLDDLGSIGIVAPMLAPTSLKQAPYYPVTTSLAGAAIVVSLLWWTGNAPDVFFMDGSVWEKWKLWRA